MDKIGQLVQVQASMMVYLALGFICRKAGIINDTSEKSLSKAITDIVFPCMIFNAMVDSLDSIDWIAAGTVTLISACVFAGSYILGKYLFFRRYGQDKKAVLIFGAMISNAAFIGLPLVSGTFGTMGIFYTTIYMTVSRCFLWTIGVALFPNGSSKHPVLTVLKNPNSIAMFAAIIYWLLPFRFPAFLMDAVKEVGNMSTVFCMVMVGSLLSGASMKDLVGKDVFYYCAVRLGILPLALLAVLKAIGVDAIITAVMVLLVSTPGPTLGSVLATRYGGDKKFASCIVLTSTLFSLATIPLIAFLYC